MAEEEVAEVVAAHLLEAYRLEPDADDAEQLRERRSAALLQAGERAGSLGASSEALRYFEQAGELAGDPRAQAAALARAGEMAMRAGEAASAESLFERAVALYESVGDTHAAARASSWLAFAEQVDGRIAQAIERMERAYEVVAGDAPDADLAMLLNRLAQAHWFAGHSDEAIKWTEEALDIAESLRLPEMLVRGWVTKGGVIAPRRPAEARGLYELARDMALENELPMLVGSTYANLSDLDLQRDRYADSLLALEQLLEFTRRTGNRRNEWFALSEMSYALTMLGRWGEAFARLAEIPEELIGRTTTLSSPLSGVLQVHLHRGETDEARRLLGRYEELGRSADVQEQSAYHAAAAAVRLAEGKPADALAAAEQAFETRTTLGLAAQDVKHAYLFGLEAALAVGNRQRVEELLTIVDESPVGLRPPFLLAIAHRFRARLAGDDPAADREFVSAAAILRELELPFHLAVVLLEHGEWLIARGRPVDAEPFLAEAGDTFERLEARPWVERLDALRTGAASEVPV